MKATLPELWTAPVLCSAMLGACAVEPGTMPPSPRPTVAVDTSTDGPGVFQVAAGGLLESGADPAVPASLSLGIGERAQIGANWSPENHPRGGGSRPVGVGDLFVGAQYRFLDQDGAVPSAGAFAFVAFPFGDAESGLDDNENNYYVAGSLTEDFPESSGTVTLYTQFGVLPQDTGGTEYSVLASLMGVVSIGGSWSVFGELGGSVIPTEDADQIFTTAGVQYAVSDNLYFDGGWSTSLSDGDFGVQITFGVTWSFGGG